MAISSKKTGKEQIVEKLLIENYEQYYRLAYSYVHNEADALDIVQEGAYKAILKCDTLREVSFAGTWIYRIPLIWNLPSFGMQWNGWNHQKKIFWSFGILMG